MTEIERCPHDTENPYTMISTALIRDENLHPTTRWILISLLSNKPGWKINAKQFVKSLKPHGYGRDKVHSFFQQACEVGYMKKVDYFEKGLKRTKYLLSERPKFKETLPQSAEQELDEKTIPPGPAQPTPADQAHKYYNRSSKEELRKEDYAAASPTPPFSHNRVVMQQHHYQKLVSDYGKEKIDEMVIRLDDYADINPKRFKQYANHATVIRTWLREEMQKNGKTSYSYHNLLEKLKEKHINLFRNGEIEILNKSICFKKGTFYLELEFADKDFVLKLNKQLQKMGVNL